MLEIKLDAELVIEKLFLITIFLIFICVIYRVNCETIPEEIFDMRTISPSLENTEDHPTALRSQRSYPGHKLLKLCGAFHKSGKSLWINLFDVTSGKYQSSNSSSSNHFNQNWCVVHVW